MKTLKKILSVILSAIVCLLNPCYVFADNFVQNGDNIIVIEENIPFEKAIILNDIGKISIKSSIIINGIKNNLYPTFDNKNESLLKFKEKEHDFLAKLKDKNDLDDLTDNNWREYYKCIYSLENSDYYDISISTAFFDIYEGDYLNEEILSCVNSNSSFQEKEEFLYYNLPYTSPFVSACSENRISFYSEFDKNSAIQYANNFASNPNLFDFEFFEEGDCANFGSQIMERGGISQDNSVEWPSRGWWHSKDGNAHYYSNSWIRARDFARYFGVDYSTTSHYNFSYNIQAGVFIVLDIDSNGTWDHVGFVVNSDSYLTNGYYDYFVAQHSDNYLAWASTYQNHWEEYESQGSTYGIIRP